MKKRVLSLILAAVMLTMLLPFGALPVKALNKQNNTRAIGIVFDNSGSMYGAGNTAWCRATYAMEVFAAMMNDEDELQIYPMWPICVDGSNEEFSCDHPLVIKGPDGAENIRKIVTINALDTPIESITAAHDGLMQSNADEKYLIVMTDGTEFYQDGFNMSGKTKSALTKMLDEYSRDMKVMYLGIGSGNAAPEEKDSTRQYYTVVHSSQDVLKGLTDMSNSIFGRNELQLSGTQVTFDVTMSKIIVFAQGDDVSDVTVSGGTRAGMHAAKYSQNGLRNGGTSYDGSLEGVLVTYKDLDAGTYEVNCTGTPKQINVYFEPDVDLSIELVDSSGNVVDPMTQEIGSGDYFIRYCLVDKYGEPTDSSILGQVEYDLTYGINGKEERVTQTNSGSMPIHLDGGDVLTGDFSASFLERYSVHKGMEDLPWPSEGIDVQAQPPKELRLEIAGGADQYALSTLEKDAVYEVKAFYGDEQLTGDKLDTLTLEAGLKGGNAKVKTERTADGFEIRIRYNGSPEDTESGHYTLTTSAVYVNTDKLTVQSTPQETLFAIDDDSTRPGVRFDIEQDFFMKSKVQDDDGFRVVLTLGGEPLTPEQFRQAKIELDTAGLACRVEPDETESCYHVYLLPDQVENGKYRMICTGQVPNEIGVMQDVSAKGTLEIQPYPGWLRIVLLILLILLLILLIWLYMNAKILPKRISVSACTFIVDGETIPGAAHCVYTGAKKKRGTLQITSPSFAANPAAKCGLSMNLEAVSPRRVRSGSRSATVVSLSPSNPMTSSVRVGAVTFVKDPAGTGLVKNGGKPGAPISISLRTNGKVAVAADVLDPMDGGEIPVSINVTLRFY